MPLSCWQPMREQLGRVGGRCCRMGRHKLGQTGSSPFLLLPNPSFIRSRGPLDGSCWLAAPQLRRGGRRAMERIGMGTEGRRPWGAAGGANVLEGRSGHDDQQNRRTNQSERRHLIIVLLGGFCRQMAPTNPIQTNSIHSNSSEFKRPLEVYNSESHSSRREEPRQRRI